MTWRICNARDRELLVAGAENGCPTFTRETERALRFDAADKARKWIERNTVTAFGELVLMREAGGRAEGRRGLAAHYGRRAHP